MQPVEELAQLALLVRQTADVIGAELGRRLESDADRGMDLENTQAARTELGLAFQALARAARILDVTPREDKPSP